jgi:hypothetical protein
MTTATEVLGGVFDADMYRPSFEAGISLNPDTKENESSWIFEPCLTCSNAVRRVQHPGFSLVTWVCLSGMVLPLRCGEVRMPRGGQVKPPVEPWLSDRIAIRVRTSTFRRSWSTGW